MSNRIILLRKTLNLSQTAFGEKLGVSRSVINNIERELTNLKTPLFRLICSTFNVNPDWLTTGKGEMFLPHNDNTLSSLQKEYNLSDNAMKLIHNFIQMNSAQQDELLHTLNQLIGD